MVIFIISLILFHLIINQLTLQLNQCLLSFLQQLYNCPTKWVEKHLV